MTADFDYFRPDTLREASELLTGNKNSMILAGGTDLLVKIRGGSHRPARIVDIKKIPGRDLIQWKQGELSIGAGVTWTALKENRDVAEFFPALHQSCMRFGCFEIRNRATVGGNICSGSPGCESGGPLLVYDAKVEIFNLRGNRTMPVSAFFTGPGRTVVEPGEILTEILLPKPPEGSRSAYRRTARVKGQDLAICAVSLLAENPGKPEIRKIRTALSAVMKTPSRALELEEILSGKPITGAVLEEAENWLENNLHPRESSLRGTPLYKKAAIFGMLKILLEEMKLLQ